MDLLSNAYERHLIVFDDTTKSGRRDLMQMSYDKFYYIVASPDSRTGYIVLSKYRDSFEIYELDTVFATTKEASDYMHLKRIERENNL